MRYEDLQRQTRTELARRLGVLGADVTSWTGAPRIEKIGLSSTQRLALLDLMEILQERQGNAFKDVDKALPPLQFADGQAELLLEMTGAQEIWSVFRTILGQYEDQSTEKAVKASARIAGDCYATCIRQARAWQAITPDKFREQPVVYLEAVESPAAAGRRDQVRALSSTIRQWRDIKLPLPIVLLPLDYRESVWTFCALHHEVGHNIDQDFSLVAELRGGLLDLVPEREPHWRRWSREILADALGLILGGAGFASSVASMAMVLGPATRFRTIDKEAVHPPLFLRVRLLTEMLKQTAVPGLLGQATQMTTIWERSAKPQWLTSFADEAPKVAEHFLKRNLTALANHSLLEMNPSLAQDYDRMDQLANFFLTGRNRPVPSKDWGMHPRLVPSAAQLAVQRAPHLDAAVLQSIHASALAYMDLIPPIETLAAPVAEAAQRRQFLQQLTRDIDFRKVGMAR